MALDPVRNFAISRVATAPSPATTGTTLVLDEGDGALFPAPATSGAFNVVIYPNGEQPDSTNAEIVRVTGRTADTLTIQREQEGTSARTIAVGDIVMLGITAKMVEDLSTAVTDVITEDDVLDEDNMASNSDTKLATQQSIKAYIDTGKAGASYTGFITSNTTTTSTTGIQVGSAQVTIKTKGGPICMMGSAVLSNSVNTARLSFDIDGTMQSDNSLTSSSTSEVVVASSYKAVSAGSHTIKLVYYTQSGGTSTLYAYRPIILLVWEL